MTEKIWTLAELVNALNAAIAKGNGNLYINNELKQELPALDVLLGYLGRDELLISDALLTQSPYDVTVSGTAFTFKEVLYNVRLVGSVVAGKEYFTLTSTPYNTTNWTFYSDFAPLPQYLTATDEGMIYEESFFYTLALSSVSFVAATFDDAQKNISAGLTFSAILDATSPGSPFSSFSGYLPGSSALNLAGTMEMGTETFPLIDLRAPVPDLSYVVGNEHLRSMYLRLEVKKNPEEEDLDENLEDRVYASTVQLGGQLSLDETNPASSIFFLEASMLQGMDVWAFSSLPGEAVDLTQGKGELDNLLIDNPLPLPPLMLGNTRFILHELGFGITPEENTLEPFVQYIRATVGTAAWFPPLPNIKLDPLVVEWTTYFYPELDVEFDAYLSGTIVIGDNDGKRLLEAEATFPEFTIDAQLPSGQEIDLAETIEWFTGIQVNLGGLTITELDFWAYPDQQEYEVFTEITGDWPLLVPGITFGLMNFSIYYTPNILNAAVDIRVALGEKIFSVRANTPPAGEGWIFSGALMPGQSFSLGEFLGNLVPGWNVPSSITAIEITSLYLSFDTASTDYIVHVQVNWDYPLLDYPFHIAAEFMLQAVHSSDREDPDYSGLVRGDIMINNLAISTTYRFSPQNETITFEIAYKQLMLRAELVTTKKADGSQSKKLVVDFPDLSLGEMLTYLINLAAPNRDFALPAPWDALNQIVFRNVQLVVDLQTNDVTVRYDIQVDLVFIAISSIELTYRNNDGLDGVELALSASFFGKEYSIDEGDPLAWDVLNDPAPSVPAKGPEFLDLKYLGFGQHVSFSGNQSVDSVNAVLDLMKKQMTPVKDESLNPLTLENASLMRFDRASHFLIGAQFSVLNTVGVGMIFNDPYLYGLALDLMGPRVGAFAGMHFELLYQRISNDLGVFKITLRVPDQFRQMELGSLSLTLPVIKLDIYTNGDFRIDLGFPAGGNYSDSFSLQFFPFVGNGGFYFGWLSGDASTRVPQITNGSFDPVIEAGIGMRVGMGKSIAKGPLSGGLSILVEGILEGTLAWFTPRDRALEDAKYYWVQGAVSIVGKLYGRVDFVVLKISVTVEVSVTMTLQIEAYETTIISLRLRVNVSASITILFIKVSFSFSLDIAETFTIGSPTTPPWILAPPTPPTNAQAIASSQALGVQPRLRLQRPLYRRRSNRASLLSIIRSQPDLTARLPAHTTSGATSLNWNPVNVFLDDKKNLGMSLIPSFTVATPRSGQGSPQEQIVLLLTLENSRAVTPTDYQAGKAPLLEHSARAMVAAETPFNLLLQAMLKWSINALLGRHAGYVTQGDLELLKKELETLKAGPSYEQLASFFGLNFLCLISGIPLNYNTATSVDSTIFPIIPELSYRTKDQIVVNFSTQTPVDAQYEKYVQDYYDRLQVNYDVDRTTDPLQAPQAAASRTSKAPGEPAESMATMIFKMYFLMLAQSAVQAGLDVLQSYQYLVKANDSLNSISEQFTALQMQYQVKAGDTVASICDEFGMTVQQLEDLNEDEGPVTDPLMPGRLLTVQIGVTPQTLAKDNQTVPLQKNKPVTLTGILYQVRDGDTLNDLAQTFYQSGPELILSIPANQQNPFLLRLESSLLIAQPGEGRKYTSFAYRSVQGDYLDLLASFIYVRVSPAITETDLAWYKQTIADFNAGSGLDLSTIIPANFPLLVPSALNNSQSTTAITYRVHEGDTLDLVARYFLILQNRHEVLDSLIKQLIASNPTSTPWNNLPAGTLITVPAQTRIVQPADTFASLASLFYLNPSDLAGGPNSTSKSLLAPLAVLQIPDVSFELLPQDTLAGLAERFNLPLSSLASDLASVEGLLYSHDKATVFISGIPTLDIDKLAEEIFKQDHANQAAGMISRFTTSGLQLPVPEALSTFQGMYELAGQQLLCPSSSQLPYQITFTKPANVNWIEFVDSKISSGEEQEHRDLLTREPRVAMWNPGVNWNQPPRKGLHLFTTPLPELVLEITEKLVVASAPARDFKPLLIGTPAALPLSKTVPVRYGLQTTMHWQAAALPSFVEDKISPEPTPLTGEPSIWMFTTQLMDRVAQLEGSPANFALSTISAENRAEDPPEKRVQRYDWATLIEMRVRQIVATDGDGSPMRNSYEFTGTDQAGRDLLRLLFTYLNLAGTGESGTRIYLLFQPNAESNNAQGFASEVVDNTRIFLLKTNLSTLTTNAPTSPGKDQVGTSSPYMADFSQPEKFLRLLWEGSVTGTGGYTLHYSAGPRQEGLPNQVFTAGSEARLALLVLLGSQSDQAIANRKLYPFNNCVVVGDNIDPAAQSVFVSPTDATAENMVNLPTFSPGNIGFKLERTNPDQESIGDPGTLTRQLYSMLGYQIAQHGPFSASAQGTPLSPTTGNNQQALSDSSVEKSWYYSQVLPIAPSASSTLPICPALPAADQDPYAGIVANSQVEIDLTFYDLYGNYTLATPTIPHLFIDVGYTDDIIGIAQWPGITSAYEILAQGQAVIIRIEQSLQVSNYMPTTGNSFDAVLQSASSHLDRYSKIYYQFWQNDVGVRLTTTLNSNKLGELYQYVVDKVPLGNFINASSVFLNAATQLQLARYTLLPGDTLYEVALHYAPKDSDLLASTIAALGQVNRDVPTSEYFKGNIRVPTFYTVAQGDTLASIASHATNSLDVATLEQNNANVELNPGVDMTTPVHLIKATADNLSTIAAAAKCSVGGLAEANATRRNILSQGQQLTVNKITVTVEVNAQGETQSFTDLVAAFLDAGIAVTPAQIAVANQTLNNIFQVNQTNIIMLEVRDYIIEAGMTFAILADRYKDQNITLKELAEAAQDTPDIYLAGVPLYLQELDSVKPGETITLASIAQIQGLSVDQLATFNATTLLQDGKLLFLADRVEINNASGRALAPYSVQENTSLNDIAGKFREIDAITLAERNRSIRFVFLPGQTIVVNNSSTVTSVDDSLESVWKNLYAQDSTITFAFMVSTIATQVPLLRPGAFLVCSLPTTPPDANDDKLNVLSELFNVTPALLAQANSSLQGFVREGVEIQVDGIPLTTYKDETFNSLVERLLIDNNLQTSVTAIAEQNAGKILLNPGITFLLPPCPVISEVNLGNNYGQQPSFPETIFKLTTELIVQRDLALVAENFRTMPNVHTSRSTIAPKSSPAQEPATLSLWEFAYAAEHAFQNKIKLAISGKAETNTQQVWVVNFGTGGIPSVTLAGSQPNFFAVRPLSTKLLNETNVLIRSFDRKTGLLEPEGTAIKMDFQNVDLAVWVGIVLPAIDLLLSPAYAVPAYDQNDPNPAMNDIITAKETLAKKISQSVAAVLDKPNSGAQLSEAQERLRQELLINLTRGFATDVIIQYTSTASSPFTTAENAPRLSGLPVSNVYQTGERDTLATLSEYYQVSQVGLAALLGPVVRILNSNASVIYNNQPPVAIQPDDTLNTLMYNVKAPDYQSFVDGLVAPEGLFAPNTTINIYKTQTIVKNMGVDTPTFVSAVEYFDAPLETIAPQNQERVGIFKEGATISVPDYDPVTVEPGYNTLKAMAGRISQGHAPLSPLDLARAISTTPNLLEKEFTFHVVKYVPEYNLSSFKTSLYNGSSSANLLLNLKSQGQQKKLLLDLEYRINELEYDIYTQPNTGGFQASSWLSFIIPIGADPTQPQVINPQLGQIEIPLPLRSYPVAPLLLEQSFAATHKQPATVTAAKNWNYAYSYQHQGASQDTLYLTSQFNLPVSKSTLQAPSSNFFTNMAQFVSVYADVKANLTELLVPRTSLDSTLKNTLRTFADMVGAIAATWPVSSTNATETSQLSGALGVGYRVNSSAVLDEATDQLLLSTLTLTLQTAAPPAPTGHFPTIFWRSPGDDDWKPLIKNTSLETAQQCIYEYKEDVPALQAIEHRFQFEAIDLMNAQNANSQVILTRNEFLVSSGKTRTDFIYKTGNIQFPNVLQPLITHTNLIPFRNGNATLEKALEDLFNTLLGPSPANYAIKLSALFGYDLVVDPKNQVDPLISLLPILFQPVITYTNQYPSSLAEALKLWQQNKPFGETQGLYIFDLTIYSTLTSTRRVPLLELKGLYYDRSPQASQVKRTRL